MLGAEHDQQAIDRLLAAKAPAKHRPYIAVTSHGGHLVNAELGEATELLIYEDVEIDGRHTTRLVDTRRTPPPGGGAGRWAMLAGIISDCQALICNQLGNTPRMVLSGAGVRVFEADGLISEATGDVFAARRPRRELPERNCATNCDGPGDGCA
jgi:nitrogen fixation protein NifB